MSVSTQYEIDLKTGYFVYYILILCILSVMTYISISITVGIIVYWAIHYLLKASQSNVFFIHSLSYGSSMMPALPDGLKIVFLIYPFRLKTGDVVMYISDSDQLVMHRIYNCEESVYYLKGDNNEETEVVHETDIKAKQLQVFSKLLYIPVSPLSVSQTI